MSDDIDSLLQWSKKPTYKLVVEKPTYTYAGNSLMRFFRGLLATIFKDKYYKIVTPSPFCFDKNIMGFYLNKQTEQIIVQLASGRKTKPYKEDFAFALDIAAEVRKDMAGVQQ